MKKYVFLVLVCFPVVAFGASSVRTLGSSAVVGVAGANKITPVKASSLGSIGGGNVARVGSLRAKATTVNTPSAVSGTTTRFPVVSPTRLFNTAMAPRPTGSVSNTTIINTDADIENLTQRVENIENLNSTSDKKVITTVNKLDANADTVLVNRGSGNPFLGKGKPDDRAWIWVEE